VFESVSWWQRNERTDKFSKPVVRSLDTNPSAELLQHIDACPTVRRIHHQMHRSIRIEHSAQSLEPRIGFGKMMEDPGAHDLIETHP
jgi:hypothetical protein